MANDMDLNTEFLTYAGGEDTALLEREATDSSYAVGSDELLEIHRKSQEKRSSDAVKTYRTAIISLAAIALVLAVGVILAIIGWIHEEGTVVTEIQTVEIPVTVTEYIAIDPTVEYSHELSGDTFLLEDSSYGYILMYALAGVDKNEYDESAFVIDDETGYITYDDGDTVSVMGIDVSVYQGDIDWEAVKAAGVEFAIIRCGYRGYVTGVIAEDANFRRNIEGAIGAGLDVGAYFFSQALTVEEALDEAEFCISLLEGYELSLPVLYDWEIVNDPDGDTARTAYIQPQDLTDNFLVFAERLELAGYEAGLYSNKKTAVWKYDLSRIGDRMFWFAGYTDTPTLYYDFDIWQYSSSGTVDGISGKVDMNILFKSASADE